MAEKKNLGVIYMENFKCTPSTPSAPSLGVDLVLLDRILRATTRKWSSTIFRKKVHPRQNPGYAYVFPYEVRMSKSNFRCITNIDYWWRSRAMRMRTTLNCPLAVTFVLGQPQQRYTLVSIYRR